MRIIIPMAGHSRRFQKAGYALPKPFIPIDGVPMIQRVCRMFSPTDEFIFICQQAHAARPDFAKILNDAAQHTRIIPIVPHEFGPVYSALKAASYIEDRAAPLILTYCDFTLLWNYPRFLRQAAQYEGAIPVFRGFHPASFGDTYYAYVRANEAGEMLELREKQSFTENRAEEYASTGVYYFESWNLFEKYGEELLRLKFAAGAEYYASLIYNLLVRDGHKVSVYEAEKFICWGTPEDLAEYRFWSEYFGICHFNQI
ncbi:MAG: NTP transferase domain-containing protein [Candidatus Omnitrophica bacterium]|nr:NTP transferase domain-containing protein [Candidatus Omnitrophota bacterium]